MCKAAPLAAARHASWTARAQTPYRFRARPPISSRMLAVALTGLLLQVTPAQLQRIRWVPNPRALNGTWVADPAHHLADTTVAALNREISALEQATGAELAVVVVDSTSGLEPFDFALAIHRGWGVGKRGMDNGVVFLWVPPSRAVQISVGYGLEGVLPDRKVGRIRDEQVFAAFRRNAFDAGVLAGVRALIAAAREETRARHGITPQLQPGTAARGASRAADERGGTGVISWLLGVAAAVIAVVGGVVGVRRRRRYRPRPCPKGHGMMRLLDEASEDAKLDKGAQIEEQIKSVDWDVWVCDACGETERIPYRSWHSSYGDCPKCSRRTVRKTDRQLSAATTMSEGRKEVTRTCMNCGWSSVVVESIPMIDVTSSGSGGGHGGGGGGGSSFGGGSAGGGGAGGHY